MSRPDIYSVKCIVTLDNVNQMSKGNPMPDLDRLPRGVRKGWGKVADAMLGAHPPDVVADAVEKALAKTLRVCGNLSWLQDLDDVVVVCQQQGTSRPLEDYVRTLEPRITRGVESAFIDVARQLATSPHLHSVLGGQGVLVAGLLRMVDKLCLGPIGPDLVPRVFATHAEYQAYSGAVRSYANTASIANQIARRNFDVTRLRAPRSRLERPGTAELLHVPIA